MTVDFGLGLPFPGPRRGAPVKHWMDDLDTLLPSLEGKFRSLWITDHFFWLDDPTYEAWTVMSYLAAHFPRYEVGPMVLGQSYRNPALLAKMAATLQCMSEGRFIMGIGAGWKEDEYKAYNYPFPSVGKRMGELINTLEIFKRLWTQPGQVTYQGKHYQVIDAWCEPKPVPPPPILIGAKGEQMLKIVARYADWWNASDANIALYTEKLNILKRHCADIGRDPNSIRWTWFGRLAVGKTEAEAVARGRRIFPGEDLSELPARGRDIYTRDNAFVGTPSQIVELMRPFVELGVDYFMVEVLDPMNPEVMGMVAEDILPKVHRT